MFEKYGLVYEEENLKKHTTYKIETICKYLIMPNSIDNLIELIKYLKIVMQRYGLFPNNT